jgi:hypothetical protein
LAYHNWRRPLPRPIVLPDVPLKLSTLADVRALVHKRLPEQHRSKQTWQRVATVTSAAARGELPADDCRVLSLEGISARMSFSGGACSSSAPDLLICW